MSLCTRRLRAAQLWEPFVPEANRRPASTRPTVGAATSMRLTDDPRPREASARRDRDGRRIGPDPLGATTTPHDSAGMSPMGGGAAFASGAPTGIPSEATCSSGGRPDRSAERSEVVLKPNQRARVHRVREQKRRRHQKRCRRPSRATETTCQEAFASTNVVRHGRAGHQPMPTGPFCSFVSRPSGSRAADAGGSVSSCDPAHDRSTCAGLSFTFSFVYPAVCTCETSSRAARSKAFVPSVFRRSRQST